MRRKLLVLSILAIIVMCGCSSENSSTELDSLDVSDKIDTKIELLEAMEATNISYLEPFDENTVYIIGAKRDKSLPKRELVYAVCKLNTGNVTVLHREIIPFDWAYNMSVYGTESGNIKIFTGQQILTLQGSEVLDINNVVGNNQYEVYVDLKSNKMVFTDNVPPSLFYGTVSSDERTLIYESEQLELEGKKVDLFPYGPRLNNNGDKILYGKAIDDTSNYQSVAISSTNGSLLAETDNLQINADFLDFLWYNNEFVTLELTDSYENSPTGLATIFTQYNSQAKMINKNILHGIALSCQRKFYSETSLFAFEYKTASTNGLSLWDASTNQFYYVRDIKDNILAPTVTPNGGKILWYSSGYLFADTIEINTYEKLPTYS